MIDLKDFTRPSVLLAMAASAAAGFAAGYLLGRDPQILRRAMAAAAQAWEGTRVAAAEAREDLADHWAEATEVARQDIEETAFAAAAAAAAPEEAPAATQPKPRPRPAATARTARAKRGRASTSRRAPPRTTH
jgi:hypothetical protein